MSVRLTMTNYIFVSVIADDIERTVTIQLDGEEYTMEFIDALPWDVSCLSLRLLFGSFDFSYNMS